MEDFRHKACIISRIRLENFMCHGNLEIEFGDYVNFITGQNGSGKSAILTALCIAFGSRARDTQRANTLKDFIRTGCSYALVRVEIKNQGPDAFKPDVYGDLIVVERRISESTSSITLKNRQGRKMGTKRDDLREVIEHFNIDVENPCVIMSQDKSREFLHSGNAKDKFKFFYKATLLQRVDDLLKGIENQLSEATAQLHHLEQSLRPVLKELDELQEKIDSIVSTENDSLDLQLVRKKLAWALVYVTERQIGEKSKEIEKLKARKLSCQQQIDMENVVELNVQLEKKKSEIDDINEKTSEVDIEKERLKESYYMARMEELNLKSNKDCLTMRIQDNDRLIKSHKQQIHALHEQHIKETQAEKNKIEEKLRELEAVVGKAKANCQSLQANEDEITKAMTPIDNDIKDITKKIDEIQRQADYKFFCIREFQKYQENKGTPFGAFGGRQVTNLWQAIEQDRSYFTCPPIGPIGAHVKLINGGSWSIAVETAIGKLLDAFIVTNYVDAHTLRKCARRAGHRFLRIIIYDFSRPRLQIQGHMLPETNHPTVLSVLHTNNHIVYNVLIDEGSADMQVLVEDYNVGKTIAFDPNIKNVKEVFTSRGQKLFQRRSAQIILPLYQKLRNRLCVSYDDQITKFKSERDALNEKIQENQGLKRSKENELNNLRKLLKNIQNSKQTEEHNVRFHDFELKDLRNALSAEADTAPAFNVDELNKDISDLCDERQRKQIMLEDLQIRIGEAGLKTADCNASLKNFVDSTEAIGVALFEAENELVTLGAELLDAMTMEKYYEEMMRDDVLTELENAATEYVKLGNKIKELRCKASILCPVSDIKDLNCEEINPEHLSAEYTRLSDKIKRASESGRFLEPIEDVRMIFEKKKRKISWKQQTYKALREKLEVCEKALELRYILLKRNERIWIHELRQEHLVKKGIQGRIRVNVEEKILSIEVTMPQDASNTAVCDTRGLSGGERSFSTLCFALTIHGMTEAPFRAMDEFDVLMDAVSRKISLDAVVDFALEEGSQWIFITPQDISMVRDHERIKKQQMAAPRG